MQKHVNGDQDRVARPARGRPRSFDRAQSLDAAMRVFWLNGYASTAISDLTAAMGIGTTSLYAAFGSKEQLYTEALQHYLSLYEAGVWSRFKAAETAREAIEALLVDTAYFVAQGSGAEDPLGCMTTHPVKDDSDNSALALLMRSLRTGMFDRVKERLSRAVHEGEISTALDLGSFARFIITLQNGMSVQARAGVSHAQLDEAAKITMKGWPSWIG
ncbi:transcriptional regulator, TetR family [Novosphingobium sp. B1]|nr:transcriptional regulator, TetR family [Novosphingobium sp. B1]